jgi:hypothetical protein
LSESPEAEVDVGAEESTVVVHSTKRSDFVERLRHRKSAIAVGSLLAILSLPLGRTTPGALLDRSFPLGLSLAHVNGLRFGKDIVFTYGPLGFLASPQSVFRTGEVLGVLYAGITAFALYSLFFSWARRRLPLLAAAALTVVFSAAATHAGVVTTAGPAAWAHTASPAVPELGGIALLLAALYLVEPRRLGTGLSVGALLALGGIAALQTEVKFSVGVFSLAVVLIVAASRRGRWRNLAITAAGFAASFVLLWVAAGQRVGDISSWVRTSITISFAYNSAMAYGGGPALTRVWLVLVPGLLALTAFSVVLVRMHRSATAPSLLLLTGGLWFFFKAGFERLDYYHYPITYVAFVAVLAVVGFKSWWSRFLVPALAFAYAVAAIWLTPAYLQHPTITDVVDQHRKALDELVAVARDTVDQRWRNSRLETAAREIRAFHNVSPDVVAPLLDQPVHADPWDVSAVWAYGLRWQPVPMFQSYAAFSASLDELNAHELQDPDGPVGVLQRPQAIDGRFSRWESPAYMEALTCYYRPEATDQKGWTALRRGTDRCGTPTLLGTSTLPPGVPGLVPNASAPTSLVVATFDYPVSLTGSLVDTLLKQAKQATVVINGTEYRFLPGTANSEHLMRVPASVSGDALANGPLDIQTISFPTAVRSVTVRYFEIPVGPVVAR